MELLVDEMCQLSPEYKMMWRDNNEVRHHGERIKHIKHPVFGKVAFEYSALDRRPDLSLVVYHPTTAELCDPIAAILANDEGQAAVTGR